MGPAEWVRAAEQWSAGAQRPFWRIDPPEPTQLAFFFFLPRLSWKIDVISDVVPVSTSEQLSLPFDATKSMGSDETLQRIIYSQKRMARWTVSSKKRPETEGNREDRVAG